MRESQTTLMRQSLPNDQLFEIWSRKLHVLATCSRDMVLTDTEASAPLLMALGGDVALGDAAEAILETGRWFP